jgi:ATP-dependent DNA ligase
MAGLFSLKSPPGTVARYQRRQCDAGHRPCPKIVEHIADVAFQHAFVMGLEGIVAKRRDSRYRSGRCRSWVKVRNPAHPGGRC